VPLLPAVFGEAGKHEGALPYHCADVAVARAHPLFQSFRQLLDLPLSRLTAPEVVDLLDVPQIARRLNLDIDEVEVLTRWLKNSRVAWGLDGAFRGRFDVPQIPEHTFSWAMDRMIAGYIMGQPDDEIVNAVTLADGIQLAPLDGIHGPQSALLGALDRLLVELNEWCADGHARLKASVWAERLEKRVETIFLIDPMDNEAREAKAYVLRFIRALASEPQESGLDPELEFSVVREILLGRLDAVPERQRFLMGGVTFCGMVPQRAIPFKVVAVLGLNDGDFPRASSDGGLDLMGKHRRMGDRDVRSDDRYLFLETLMSARDVLHLSFIGEGVRDGKPRNPAAPLAELMAALDHAKNAVDTENGAESDEPKRPWFVRHPLQPFDDRYFNKSDVALFSFHGEFAGMRKELGARKVPLFVESANCSTPAKSEVPVPLREVFAYYKDPAKQLLANGLNLRLDALDNDRLRDSEPLEAKFDALDQVAKRLFIEAVTHHRDIPKSPPDWLRLTGLLPPGKMGKKAWRQETETVQSLIGAVDGDPLFMGCLPETQPVLIDRLIGQRTDREGFRLQGELRRVYEKDDALWVMEVYPSRFGTKGLEKKSEANLDFKARVGFFLEWALVRLSDQEGKCAVHSRVVLDGKRDGWQVSFEIWDTAFMAAVKERDVAMQEKMIGDLENRVFELIAFWQQSQQQQQWYFPKTSWTSLAGDANKAIEDWAGSFERTGERDYSPGYARMLAGERDFSEEADYELLRKNAIHLYALINLTLSTEQGT
jgi:exodeoxyribonuclease V gamma subunit